MQAKNHNANLHDLQNLIILNFLKFLFILKETLNSSSVYLSIDLNQKNEFL